MKRIDLKTDEYIDYDDENIYLCYIYIYINIYIYIYIYIYMYIYI